MYGNWRWNLGFGLFGAVFIFIIGISHNPIQIALLRGLYSFVTFFLIAYPLRFILGTFVFSSVPADNQLESAAANEVAGQNIDYVALDKDEDLNEALKAQLNSQHGGSNSAPYQEKNEQAEFKPLQPTQLFSSDKIQPEDMTKVIRRLTGE